MATLSERVEELEIEMYRGDGKENPSVLSRLALIEEAISSLRTVKWLLAGAILTAVFNIISTHVSLKF